MNPSAFLLCALPPCVCTYIRLGHDFDQALLTNGKPRLSHAQALLKFAHSYLMYEVALLTPETRTEPAGGKARPRLYRNVTRINMRRGFKALFQNASRANPGDSF